MKLTIPMWGSSFLRTKRERGLPITMIKIEVTPDELSLIVDALSNLSESREEEIYWAFGDPALIEADKDEIQRIENLLERLHN